MRGFTLIFVCWVCVVSANLCAVYVYALYIYIYVHIVYNYTTIKPKFPWWCIHTSVLLFRARAAERDHKTGFKCCCGACGLGSRELCAADVAPREFSAMIGEEPLENHKVYYARTQWNEEHQITCADFQEPLHINHISLFRWIQTSNYLLCTIVCFVSLCLRTFGCLHAVYITVFCIVVCAEINI